MSQRGPQKSQKSDQGRIFRGLGGEHKTELRPGFQKVRFCCYLLHLSQVGRLKKRPSLGTILGTGFVKNTKKGGSRESPKISSKKHSKVDPKMGPFGGYFETRFKAIRNFGSLAPPWTTLAPFWGHFGVILGVIFVILDAVL